MANFKANRRNSSLFAKQICSSEKQRENIGSQMVSLIACRNRDFAVRDILKAASLNNMMCLVFGGNFEIGNLNSETEELRGLVEEGYDLLGKLNLSDHLPWIASLDLQNIRVRCNKLTPRVNRFVNRIIEEHKNRTNFGRRQDFVDVLLSLNGPDKLSDHDMVAVLWVSYKFVLIILIIYFYFHFFVVCFIMHVNILVCFLRKCTKTKIGIKLRNLLKDFFCLY